jgi:hypothetical protein
MKNIRVNFEGWIQLLGMVGVLGGLVFVGLDEAVYGEHIDIEWAFHGGAALSVAVPSDNELNTVTAIPLGY